ncbi:MAG: phosphoribosylanthranilate isomerase [Gammaproteobacteria bacterium]|nr:phosphoribosylanthranilate isomerase [Gammaproteobacteria bacterium]
MHKVKVKICGITRPDDAILAAEAGADAIGLNFYQESPRAIDASTATKIIDSLPPFITKVGLFVNASPEDIRSVLTDVNLDLIQFHGEESQDDCLLFGLPYIKAVRMHEDINLAALVQAYDKSSAILIDTYVSGTHGGTGKSFDWSMIDKEIIKPVILAGGLTPENVSDAIMTVKPYAVDVSSGVEKSPGIKDEYKMLEFIQLAKELTL